MGRRYTYPSIPWLFGVEGVVETPEATSLERESRRFFLGTLSVSLLLLSRWEDAAVISEDRPVGRSKDELALAEWRRNDVCSENAMQPSRVQG
jgi:hypothetical protein